MPARLSATEIFAVGFLPARIEEDLIGGELAAEIEGVPDLAGPRAAFLEAYAKTVPRRMIDFLSIEAPLQKHGLPVPPRPEGVAGMTAWRAQLIQSVGQGVAEGSTEKAVLAVVTDVAEAWLALNLDALVVSLLEKSPKHAALVTRAAGITARLDGAIRALSTSAGELKDPLAGVVARNILKKLSDPTAATGGSAALRERSQTLGKMIDGLRLALTAIAAPIPTPGQA